MAAALSEDRIAALVAPYVGAAGVPAGLYGQLAVYLELLLKWNARTNLTAIREPDEMVRRHFGESLFCGLHLPAEATTVLDLGSGAGFPGLPIQLLRPELRVTLAESQHKKASFLREAVRVLGLETEVWSGRAELLEKKFSVVTLRAVDNMEVAMAAARGLVEAGGWVMAFVTAESGELAVPGTSKGYLRLVRY
jgi:16S rRNA (guanine527-N7)-methyltransferase